MEKYGACKMDRLIKKCSYTGKSGRRKNNAGADKEEEKKLGGPLTKKELPAVGCSRRNVNGKKVRGRRRYQMIDKIMIKMECMQIRKGRLRRG